MSPNKQPSYQILIVYDEADAFQSFEMSLKSFGLNNILLCNDSRHVMQLLASHPICLEVSQKSSYSSTCHQWVSV